MGDCSALASSRSGRCQGGTAEAERLELVNPDPGHRQQWVIAQRPTFVEPRRDRPAQALGELWRKTFCIRFAVTFLPEKSEGLARVAVDLILTIGAVQ